MRFPSAPRCPMCEAELPLAKAWRRAWGYRELLPWREFGVHCERCHAPVVVMKGRAMWVSIGMIVVGAAVSGGVAVKAAALSEYRR